MLSVGLQSKFKDYYDDEFEKEYNIAYDRNYRLPRVNGLKLIALTGAKTVDICPVCDAPYSWNEVVVYINPSLHNGLGKMVLPLEVARERYRNYLCVPYYRESAFVTRKYLQVGKCRFEFEVKHTSEVDSGSVVSCKRLADAYNIYIGMPIFSIDYLIIDGGLVALELNDVQNLKNLKMDRILSGAEVKWLILDSMKEYNMIPR